MRGMDRYEPSFWVGGSLSSSRGREEGIQDRDSDVEFGVTAYGLIDEDA